MMRKGGWRPAAITQDDVHILLGMAVTFACIRGLDYWTGDDPHQSGTIIAECFMPLKAWSLALWIGATMLVVGWSRRTHGLVFAGHFILGMLYSMLTFGFLFSYGYDLWTHGWHPYALDGIRNVGPIALIGALHVLFAIRTGTHPLPKDSEKPTEVALKEAT